MNKFEIREFRVKVSTTPDGKLVPGGYFKYGMLHVFDDNGEELLTQLQEIPATADELDLFSKDGAPALEAEVKRMGEEVGKLLAGQNEYKADCDKKVEEARAERVELRAQVRALREAGKNFINQAVKVQEVLKNHKDVDQETEVAPT